MRRIEVVKKIDVAIKAIDEHLNGTCVDSKISSIPNNQLLSFKDKLRNMKKQIEYNSLPLSQAFGMGRAIADCWPFNSIVGEKILESEQSYINFVKKIGKGETTSR